MQYINDTDQDSLVPRSLTRAKIESSPATIEINDAIFCQHFKEVCSACEYDGREENDAFFGFNPIDREGIEAPAASVNKDGNYQCKKHALTWIQPMLRLEKANNASAYSGKEGREEIDEFYITSGILNIFKITERNCCERKCTVHYTNVELFKGQLCFMTSDFEDSTRKFLKCQKLTSKANDDSNLSAYKYRATMYINQDSSTCLQTFENQQ
ncbi:hypothetical protein F5050DRAFT_963079 [Lentinula boryana]|uniref:Uncharacterized protein n=1 Tax=Lentinula boryana TaxID=40481 RepID=A0ABQ8Q1K0_9AGAR|nr:hypothetical protein F5050DRAFT_963079 [Lentinula boryana]